MSAVCHSCYYAQFFLSKYCSTFEKFEDKSNVEIKVRRASQSHEERVIALNSKLLLSLIPGGENYIVTGNSKIVSKEELARRNPRRHGSGLQNNDEDFNLFSSNNTTRGRGAGHFRGRRGDIRGGRGYQHNRGGSDVGEVAQENSEGDS